MKQLELRLPALQYKDDVLAYKAAFIASKDALNGSAGLADATTFEEWYAAVCDNSSEATVHDGLVPATTYLMFTKDDNQLVGMIDIRHRLNDYLMQYGGHIGYSIRKSERQKGYATSMLALALDECRRLNIQSVLITCDKNNIASAKTILNNHGVLENEITQTTRVTQRYWIDLT